MPLYEVSFSFHANSAGSYTGEHDTVQLAIAAAEETDLASPSLCHQCTDELELGDMDGARVYCDGKVVYDDTFVGTLSADLKAAHEAKALVDAQLADALARIAKLEAELAAAERYIEDRGPV